MQVDLCYSSAHEISTTAVRVTKMQTEIKEHTEELEGCERVPHY